MKLLPLEYACSEKRNKEQSSQDYHPDHDSPARKAGLASAPTRRIGKYSAGYPLAQHVERNP